jgi:hypothetical protein
MPGERTRTLAVFWYRFQNPSMVKVIHLKFGTVIVLGKLEDCMHGQSIVKSIVKNAFSFQGWLIDFKPPKRS